MAVILSERRESKGLHLLFHATSLESTPRLEASSWHRVDPVDVPAEGRVGITQVFGMVGHSNLGFADAMRRAEERGGADLYRDPARGGRLLRGQRVRQAHQPARGLVSKG